MLTAKQVSRITKRWANVSICVERDGREFFVQIAIFGRGLNIHNHRPLFSERYGYRKVFRILGVAFVPLKRG